MKTLTLLFALLIPGSANAHLLDFLFGPSQPRHPQHYFAETIAVPQVQYRFYRLQRVPVQAYQWQYVPIEAQQQQ
jgi:hypothetical protein